MEEFVIDNTEKAEIPMEKVEKPLHKKDVNKRADRQVVADQPINSHFLLIPRIHSAAPLWNFLAIDTSIIRSGIPIANNATR